MHKALEHTNKNRVNLSRGPFWQICINFSRIKMLLYSTFDIQTLKIALIVSKNFRLDNRSKWQKQRQIDTAIELNVFSSCKCLKSIQLLPWALATNGQNWAVCAISTVQVQFYLFCTKRLCNLAQVISPPRPSHFSAWNIENLGGAWGQGYPYTTCNLA